MTGTSEKESKKKKEGKREGEREKERERERPGRPMSIPRQTAVDNHGL